jgi:N-methylhydantoinase A/oxoprolinase/acetone carboxylase beta subunit
VIDPESGVSLEARVFRRDDLAPGARMEGVALIVEDETTTVVPPGFEATVSAAGYLILERTNPP